MAVTVRSSAVAEASTSSSTDLTAELGDTFGQTVSVHVNVKKDTWIHTCTRSTLKNKQAEWRVREEELFSDVLSLEGRYAAL